MTRFAFGLEQFGYFCLRWPRLALCILILISGLAAYGATSLEFEGDPSEIFRADNAISKATDRQVAAFPSSSETLVLLIESAASYNRTQLEAIRDLHLEVQFVEGVVGVSSIFSARKKADKDGNTPTVLPTDLPEDPQIPALLKTLYQHPLVGKLLLSKDLTTSMMVVSFAREHTDLDHLGQKLAKIKSISDQIAPAANLKVTQTGVMAIRHDVLTSLNRDVHILNAFGALFAAVICFVFFRNFRFVLISAVPPLVAVLWLLGLFGATGQPVTAMNNILPTLVLVIAFCDALHMVQLIRNRLATGEDVETAVRVAVRDVGPACAMTSLTTMAACASLMLSSSNAVREFGQAGTISVFLAFIAVITLVPSQSVLMLKKQVKTRPLPDRFNMFLATASRACGRFVARFRCTILIVSLVTLAVSGFAYFKTTTNYSYRNFLNENSPANAAIDVVDEKFGGADVFNYLVETGKASTTPPDLLLKAHRRLEHMKEVRAVFSFVTALDWLGNVKTTNRAQMDKVLQKLPRELRRKVLSRDHKTWLMTVYIPNTPAAKTRALLDKINARLDPLRRQNKDATLTMSGGIARAAYTSPLVIGGLKFSLGVAVVITILMVGVFVRSLRFALISAVPNLLPLTLVAAALYFTGNSFSLIAVLALTIAFGIAIDNTIHMVNRLQLERRKAPMGEAMNRTLEKTAPVLFAATLLLIAGMVVTNFSHLPSIRLFGSYMTTVLVLALGASIIVLPAIILQIHAMGKKSE